MNLPLASMEKVKGRYSFICTWEKDDDKWKIALHHSCVMPEGIVSAEPITQPEVRHLFKLWNDVLTTLGPTKVANRCSSKAVSLPAVSNMPHAEHHGNIDCFANFLKLNPQLEILLGGIIVRTNWAQDSGIHEFIMGATGVEVKGTSSI